MRQNPHVRICGGPGSATTLVYPTTDHVTGLMARQQELNFERDPYLLGAVVLPQGSWTVV